MIMEFDIDIDEEKDTARLTMKPGTTLTGTMNDVDTLTQLWDFIQKSPDKTREIRVISKGTSIDIEQNDLTILIY